MRISRSFPGTKRKRISASLEAGFPRYDISPDGQRFLMTKVPDQPQAALTQIHIVLNWFEELKRRVPAGQ